MFNKVAPQSGCHLFLISVQLLYLQAYTKMHSSVHKNVLKCTQKCTQVYTKMYSGVHKNVLPVAFSFFEFVIKMMLCSLDDSLCYSVTRSPCGLKIETARHTVYIQNLARKEQSRTGFTF